MSPFHARETDCSGQEQGASARARGAEMDISAALGVAVREFPLKSGSADYLLYVDGRVVGVIKAKPQGHTLTGVETQSAKYQDGLPTGLPHFVLPLPFAYESTGEV